MQIRRRWLDLANAVPAFHALYRGTRSIHFGHRDDRQNNVVIYRFVMVKCDLSARASGILISRWCFRFAVAVRRAATFRPSEHKVLFAGDAAPSDKSDEEKQRENRTGESSTHRAA